MTHYVAMIPARLGSKRVKKKNLRLLGDRPLIAHVVATAVASGEFDKVYVNSEAEVFEAVAHRDGAEFYKRSAALASDEATNDQFALDFMNSIPCDVLVQINPTSPFISAQDLRRAKELFERDECDTVLAVREVRVEGVFRGAPINWDPRAQMPPSQLLEPLYVFCNGILAWRTDVFRRNMQERGCAVYGGDGRTGYCVLRGDATLDIDTAEDFVLAETLLARVEGGNITPRYWDDSSMRREHSESLVSSILRKDGVEDIDLDDVNREVLHVSDLLATMPTTRSWSKRIINSPSNSATLICQMPGEGNRRHYHADWNEWWYIVDGKWEWEIEGKTITVTKGDLVFIEKGRLHKVIAIGDKPAIRLAVSREDVAHIYPDES